MTTLRTAGLPLTDYQRDVLLLAGRGLTSEQIARRLGSTRAGVDMAAKAATDRLGARSRTHAVALAITTGLIDPSEIAEETR
ncbi:LuxR C-terminal-related transcriptional regulator [Streptomyces xiamenensis]|uniref:LuxR C-terminal-related transcriptional regulator n=1 Tax=Streptomyces xiamenensis TaxID=408015 RepID=UPI0037CDB882